MLKEPKLTVSSRNLKASEPIVIINDAIIVPVILPIPPRTTISRILKVKVNLNIDGSIVPIRLPKSPPPIPAKKADIELRRTKTILKRTKTWM
jgi:hypothetical protein